MNQPRADAGPPRGPGHGAAGPAGSARPGTTRRPAVPALLAALCDDAALFPPGDAPVAAAVPAHRGHRAAWYAGLVGPFLVGADRVAEVGAAAAPDGALEVVLVVRAGPAALGPALAGAAAWPELRLVAVEVGPDAAGTPAEAAARACAALARELPDAVTGVVELRRAPDPAAALDAVAASPYRAKYRTGGPDAASFPPVAELAAFLSGCAERDLPFKCTAGLHRAVRHTDPATGFTHHGFLNILAATHAAAQRDPEATAHLLGTTSGTEPAAVAAGMTGHQIQRARGLFTGYGTCSIAEPLHDLAALGLLAHASLPPTTLDRP